MRLPTLYKKTSTGAIQQWTISVKRGAELPGLDWVGMLITEHGQVDGKLQTATDMIQKGKNTGKKNATGAYKQAEAEAQAKWEKQLKKGYVKTIEEAEAGAVDEIIEGGIAPMLAHKFSEQGHKIVYPAFCQPKLDGHRCIAVIKNGVATLWSRTRKPITGVPHIIAALESLQLSFDAVLDGELYNHDLKSDFEKITSYIRQEVPQPGHEIVQYHIYDVVQDRPFTQRAAWLVNRLQGAGLGYWPDCLKRVTTVPIETEDSLLENFEFFLKWGYEGVMVRNTNGIYVNKRSYDLQKVKEFDDGEFEIIGVEQGRGKMADKAIFVCKTQDGVEFRCKMKGDLDELKKYVDDPSLAVGRKLTVQYQGITGASKVPRFPVGLRFRADP